MGFPGGSDSKESAGNGGDLGSIPGSGRFPWRREWQPTPVVLPGESPQTEEPGGLYSPWDFPVKNTEVGCHFPLQGNLPDPGIKPRSPTLQADYLPSEPPVKSQL